MTGSTTDHVSPMPTDQAQANAFTLSSQSIVTELIRMHEDRTAEQSLRESRTSLLKTLDPVQMALFTSLCTTDLSIPPEMSQFMTTLTKSKTPQKAIGRTELSIGMGHSQKDAVTGCSRMVFCPSRQTEQTREGSRFSCSTLGRWIWAGRADIRQQYRDSERVFRYGCRGLGTVRVQRGIVNEHANIRHLTPYKERILPN